jgi:DNA relaxase NicK
VQVLSLGTLLNLKVTRLDAAIDYCPFTPRHLLHAQELGLSRTHAQSHGWASNGDGDTFTLGSRKSDVFLRCYDMRGFTRTELELKRGHAQEFMAGLMSRSEAEFPALFLGALRSFVDFVNVDACENISRAPLLPFWHSFVGRVNKLRIAPARAVPVVEKYLAQVRKYAAMFHVYASLEARSGRPLVSVLTELYTHGAQGLKTHHRLLLGVSGHLMV